MVRLQFGRFFSQTHPVTLADTSAVNISADFVSEAVHRRVIYHLQDFVSCKISIFRAKGDSKGKLPNPWQKILIT
jgi:hypothetical protein